MAKRRGFFAELQHQAAVAERDRQRAQAAAVRDAERRTKEWQRAQAAAQRAHTAAVKADGRERAAAEKEAKRLYAEAQEAHVESLNGDLAAGLADIDNVLIYTLDVDDHVDLNELRRVPEHPEFTSRYQQPVPTPSPIVAPREPAFVEPPAPTGLSGMLGKKKRATAVEAARTAFQEQHAAWSRQAAEVPMQQLAQMNEHREQESTRLTKLAEDVARYDTECQARQEAIDADNARLDDLIKRLDAGGKDAVEEYFGIVFGNSVYPDAVTVDYDHTYAPADKELVVTLTLPTPGDVPTEKAYKYAKAKDEVTATVQPAKEQKDRYTNLVHHIVLRTLHEVWESDRAGHVDTVALTAGVDTIDPATGRNVTIPLVAVAAPRTEFEAIDLARVTPAETLKHLNAVVSKNPHALTPIDSTTGVRG